VQEDIDYYRIGTIAKLTGLSVERLRAWERRYELVPDHRQGKTRYYSQLQLDRLQKIKRLIDAGHSISSLIELTDQHLDARLSSRTTSVAARSLRVGLIGPNLLMLQKSSKEAARITVDESWTNMDAFAADESAMGSNVDVLIAEVPLLSIEPLRFIREKTAKATHVILIYQFATAQQVESVQAQGIPTIKWPATWAEIESSCARLTGASLRSTQAVPGTFSDEELIEAAGSSHDPNGLPGHLVSLITQLNAFSEFALDCADQHRLVAEGDAATADLYEHVHVETTHARAQLELALQSMLSAELQRAKPH